MDNIRKINLKELKEKYIKGLLIPEIQRDYVMGSGGKSNSGTSDKLIGLLDAFLKCSNEKDKDFDFSCIITYCKNDDTQNHRLEIYDGQQRLTTLMLLYLFCLHRENKKEEYESYKSWYQFCGRPIANAILDQLTDENFNVDNIEVSDFSSFSMLNLLKQFEKEEKYKDITSDFFFERVKFDQVSIGSQNEIEQFFMDLNSGVKLKEYELYKAKLVHHINCIVKTDDILDTLKLKLESWPHKLDNEWLNTFLPFADFQHLAEEYEVAFIRYCFRMLCKYKYKDIENKDGITDLNMYILDDCYNIMNSLSKVIFSNTLRGVPKIVEFSWGNATECTKILKSDKDQVYNPERRCAYWNLDYCDNENHLFYIIKNILLDNERNSELDNDIVVWAYITTMDWQIDYQNEYIRLLKIMLNNIVGINLNAWYECQYKGQYLYYAKYSVISIPQYYGKHIQDNFLNISQNNLGEYENICSLVNSFLNSKTVWKRVLNKKKISENIMKEIQEKIEGCKYLENRKKQMDTYSTYEDFCLEENKFNGILSCPKEGNYLSKVILSWPTRGGVNRIDKSEDCFVLLKCYMDILYSNYNEFNDRTVSKFEMCYEKCKNKVHNFDKEKCFWFSSKIAYRIKDRASEKATTYVKRGGSNNSSSYESYWAYKFEMCDDSIKEYSYSEYTLDDAKI